jgi:hypothetical protein
VLGDGSDDGDAPELAKWSDDDDEAWPAGIVDADVGVGGANEPAEGWWPPPPPPARAGSEPAAAVIAVDVDVGRWWRL